MSNSPTVSVVMPVHNTAPFVGEAVRSILGQTCQDFEFIIVDDGSTDGSGQILDQYAGRDERMRIIHQPHSGIAATRNEGMRRAIGRYVAVMDSDDVALTERLERQVEFMQRHRDAGLCATRCSFFGDGGEFVGAMPPTNPDEIKCRMLFHPTISHTSVMIRRELVVEHDLYYRLDFDVTEDYEMYTRVLRHSRIAAIPDVLQRIRTRVDSATRRRSDEHHYRNMSRVHERMVANLGIRATNDQLGTHLSLCKWAFVYDRRSIESVERWLCHILEANSRVGFFVSPILSRLLASVWHDACAYMGASLTYKWRRFRTSTLCDDKHAQALEFARIHLSRTLEATASGRAMKRLARAALRWR